MYTRRILPAAGRDQTRRSDRSFLALNIAPPGFAAVSVTVLVRQGDARAARSLRSALTPLRRSLLPARRQVAGSQRTNMPQYLVTWTIDIDAASPVDAASEALRIQRDAESQATFFQIQRDDRPRKRWAVDLDPGGDVSVARITRSRRRR